MRQFDNPAARLSLYCLGMKRFLFLLALVLTPLAAASCPAAPPPAATKRLPDPARPDQGVMTAAVLSQVNALRCAAGLSPLGAEIGLIEVAARHSRWMALRRTLAHVSEVPGQKTLDDRLAASRLRFSKGAENIGYVGGCNRTYLEIAHAMVGWWRDSAPHRANLLTGAFTRAGVGLAFVGDCKRAYLTLDLVD